MSLCRPCYCFQHLQNCCLANKVVVESARTLIRLRAATVKRLLKESGSGASSSFSSDARGSIYMLQTLVKAPIGLASAGSLQLSVWELFRKHKLLFTGPVWIAGHVAPLNRCRIANSSILQIAMLPKPTYM